MAVGRYETEVVVKHFTKAVRLSTTGERVLKQCRNRVDVQLVKKHDY
jgi:exonuclease VII small subunit